MPGRAPPKFFSRRLPRGFTLTEIAIVLGIVGAILGGIWAAAATISQNNKINQALQEITFIAGNFRSLYNARGIDTATSASPPGVDVTCTIGVTNSFFPSSMPNASGSCTAGTTSTYPQNPWGGYAAVYAYLDANASTNGKQGITVDFGGLTQSQCNMVADRLSGLPDLIWENMNGNNQWLPPYTGNTAYTNTAILSTYCKAAGSGNDVQAMFKAR